MANKTFWYQNRVTVPGISVAARTPQELIKKFDVAFKEKYGENIVDIIQNNGGRSKVYKRPPRKCSTSGRSDFDFTVRKQLARGRKGKGW